MPADATTQNALIVIAVALSIQTLLMVCAIVAMAFAWRRAHLMVEERLGNFSARLDDFASQTRVAVGALERSAAQVNAVVHDAGTIVRTVSTAITAPRAWLVAGAASAASALSRWRRARQQQQPQQHYGAAAR